jgi:hypothetical protein
MEQQRFDFRTEIARLAAFLVNSGKLTPEGAIESISKGLINPGLLFSKFVVSYFQFLLIPDRDQRSGLGPWPGTERTFDLLWLAYEQWINRGVVHMSEAAAVWISFYGNLRWNLVHNRNDPEFIKDLDSFVAKAAHLYLSRVQHLTGDNFNRFNNEVNEVLGALKAMTKETSEVLKKTGETPTTEDR